jgi:DNA-binding GntR family transcriptional regulator
MGLTSCRWITITGTIAHRRRGAQPGSESTLIDEYEISRSTARRAVALLRDQGIVETRIRRGSFVAGGRA